MSQLSSNEYKILHSIPYTEIKWNKLLKEKLIKNVYQEDPIRLAAYLESLNNKSLIRIFSQNLWTYTLDYRLINLEDEKQTVKVSDYGKFFLENIEMIKKVKV